MNQHSEINIQSREEFEQLRMEFDQYRAAYTNELECFIGRNPGRIKTIKWEVESITETADDYSITSLELVRDDGQSVSIPSRHVIDNDEVLLDCYSNPAEVAEHISKLQYGGTRCLRRSSSGCPPKATWLPSAPWR